MTNNPVADLVARAITEYWGDRCRDYEPNCPCCQAWAQYDTLTSTSAETVGIPDGNPDLNLAAWMDIRRNQIGPWADYLIREVGKLEQEVSRLRDRHPAPMTVEAAAKDRELLQRAVDLIRGDLVVGEWKKACNEFVKDALRALSGEKS